MYMKGEPMDQQTEQYTSRQVEEFPAEVVLTYDPGQPSSLVLTYEALCQKGGMPLHTHVASVIASEQGLDYAMKHIPRQDTTMPRICALMSPTLADVESIMSPSSA